MQRPAMTRPRHVLRKRSMGRMMSAHWSAGLNKKACHRSSLPPPVPQPRACRTLLATSSDAL